MSGKGARWVLQTDSVRSQRNVVGKQDGTPKKKDRQSRRRRRHRTS